jgi:hypothetical protein
MQQLELFKPSRIADGLRLLRCELELQFEIRGYRAELHELSDWEANDPDYVRDQTDRLIHLIQLCHESLALTRAQRKLI